MAEEVKAAEPPVAASTEVEPTKTEKVESPTPDQPIETAAAPAPAPKAEETAAADSTAIASKAEETPVEEAAPALPELTNAKWGPISPNLAAFYRRLPEILEKSKHSEVYSVQLTYVEGSTEPTFGTLLILQKFLRANSDNIEKAVEQLSASLAWRAEKKPLDSLAAEHDRSAYEGLGYVQVLPETGEVLTWNIYGAVTDYKKTFANLDSFLSWRVALMEAAIAKLDLPNATKPIPDFGKGADPYQIIQVHDYLNVSFLRMDPDAKAASKATIAVFRDFYPEMLSRKFFVNVPLLMGWLYKATTLVLPEATVKKFRVLSYGKELAAELGDTIPEVYGGKGVKDVKELGDPVKLSAVPVVEPETETPAPTATTKETPGPATTTSPAAPAPATDA
ncbi:Non-classical phosphatidylinositol transfer protein (PITP), variant 2 [Orbilia oligospora]|nr:Non-classical phosphatidylinositol transfer protein (PITP) [Orbilia oligospora]KAF3089359.1 Non-classical phosphatidylinositol transfer protein (PITP), variant 2 [Orbilia oligospora]